MDELTDSLPVFTGRLSQDFSLHESRLKSFLALHNIPLHSQEGAEALQLSLQKQAGLSFELEASETERRFLDEGLRFCRERWGGEERKRLATAAALNRLNSRSFRERGQRRETVSQLVSDLELLFLQAGVTEEEARRRIFVGCFFEFPKAVYQLSRTSTLSGALEAALQWEGEMVRKERTALAGSHHAPSSDHQQSSAASRTTTTFDYPRPGAPTPGGTALDLSPVQPRFSPSPSSARPSSAEDDLGDTTFRPDDPLSSSPAQPSYRDRRPNPSLSLDALRPSIPSSSLHAEPDHSSSRQPSFHLHSRQQSEPAFLAVDPSADYPSPRSPSSLYHTAPRASVDDIEGGVRSERAYKFSCAGARQRNGLPGFATPPAPPLRSRQNCSATLLRSSTSTGFATPRAITPDFVTEATSFDLPRSASSASAATSTSPGVFDSFPHPRVGSVSGRHDENGDGRAPPFSPVSLAPLPPAAPSGSSTYSTKPISPSAKLGRSFGGLKISGSGTSKPPMSPSAGATAMLQKSRMGSPSTTTMVGEGTTRDKGQSLLGGLFRRGSEGRKDGEKTQARRRSLLGSFGGGGNVEEKEGTSWWSVGRRASVDSHREPPFPVPLDGTIGRPPKKRVGGAVGEAGGLGLPP